MFPNVRCFYPIQIFTIFILITLSISVSTSQIAAVTNFYLALPDVVQDMGGITFTIETSDDEIYNYASWTNNGSSFIPDNITKSAQPDNSKLHIDTNNYLLAILDDIPVGTRLIICVTIPYPFEQQDCQWDVVDKDKTAYAEFDFFFRS